MPLRTQNFENTSSKVIEVWIEVNPDLYTLQPNDEMSVTYDDDGAGLHINVTDDGLQIYLQRHKTAVVTINGKPAQPE